MSETISICAECRHHRTRNSVKPFGKINVWTPEILETKVKWDQEKHELAIMEQQRFESGDEFDFEPNCYPWCAQWTQEQDRFTVDPVTGEKSRIYILCARANMDGQCSFFESAP